MMTGMFRTVLVILTLSLSGVASGDSKGKVPKGVSLPGLAKGTLETSDLRGQTTVIEFFAAWCEGCSAVMKKLEKISPSKDQMFVVSLDETRSDALGYFKRKKEIRHLKKVAYHDAEASLAESLGVESLPAVFVIGPSGKVIKKIHGHPTGKQYKQIRKLLNR